MVELIVTESEKLERCDIKEKEEKKGEIVLPSADKLIAIRCRAHTIDFMLRSFSIHCRFLLSKLICFFLFLVLFSLWYT